MKFHRPIEIFIFKKSNEFTTFIECRNKWFDHERMNTCADDIRRDLCMKVIGNTNNGTSRMVYFLQCLSVGKRLLLAPARIATKCRIQSKKLIQVGQLLTSKVNTLH